MRICLVSPGPEMPQLAGAVERLAELLAGAHEVALVEPPAELSQEAAALTFCSEQHRRSAGVMEAIRAHYGSEGPDYLEFGDSTSLGFVPLQARLSGDPLLAQTQIAVRACPSSELQALHDEVLSHPKHWLRAELERWQLAQADRLVWPGGDVLGLYRRYYDGIELPPDTCIGVLPPEPPPLVPALSRSSGDPLRILFLGELRRSRGALDLLEACLSLSDDEWELTMAGADTETATMGQSVLATLEGMADEDPRVHLCGPPTAAELADRLAAADLVAVPSRVEAWSEEGVTALQAGLPLLATPVGGMVELVEEGVAGWLSEDIGPAPLAAALERLLGDRGEVERVRGAGGIASRVERLADPEPILAAYRELEAVPRRPLPAPAPAQAPLVTGIVPYYGASKFVAEAVGSLLAQTHRELEVLIVNDGSFAAADSVLAELECIPRVTVVTQSNAGEAAARNLGTTLARGEYVVLVDADNMLEPRFVERALEAYRAEPELAYVTSWLRMIDENGDEMPPEHGYAPLGNGVVESDERNWDGDMLAMFPRRLFTELGFCHGPGGSMHADWELYRWLRQEGRFGAVIPERLARYRIRPESLLRGHGEELLEWGWNESRNRNYARRVRWIATSHE
ncbi:MAG TPA: glycosyltransferase [Solirubrobacterales bacterium]